MGVSQASLSGTEHGRRAHRRRSVEDADHTHAGVAGSVSRRHLSRHGFDASFGLKTTTKGNQFTEPNKELGIIEHRLACLLPSLSSFSLPSFSS